VPEQSTPERPAKDDVPTVVDGVEPTGEAPAGEARAGEARAGETPEGEAEEPADAKAVFAAALAKKKAAGAARSAHLDGHGGVGGATANHKATRTFRRKSG
jgi:Family of unknown function (DUF5302)